MSNFKCLSKKEQMKRIAVFVMYPVFMLFSFLSKACKLFSTKKMQIAAGFLAFCIIIGMLPAASLTVLASGATHSVTINGGDNGTLKHNGTAVSGNSAVLTVADGVNLADAMTAQDYTVEANTGYALKELEAAAGTKFEKICAGYWHTVLLDKNGDVWTFGYNYYGQLGNTTNNGSYASNPTPTKVTATGLGKVTAIAAGCYHTVLLDENGDVWTFGYNNYGQLGNATNNGSYASNPTPTKVTATGLGKVTAIATGCYHTVLLDENGDVWTFGQNYDGQLGNTTNNNSVISNPTPTKVTATGLGKVTTIAAGCYHTVLLDENGDVWTFGQNNYGQLGNTTNNGSVVSNPTPTKVTATGLGKVTTIAAGWDHTVLLDASGDVWTFGNNTYGQLGNTTNNGIRVANPIPTKVTATGLGKVTAISAGNYYTVLLDVNGDVRTFGNNTYGQLGNTTNNGGVNPNPTPTKVAATGLGKVTAIAAGDSHTVLLDANGDVWTFGQNYYGLLGNTTNNDRGGAYPTPTKIDFHIQILKADSFADIIVTKNMTVTAIYIKRTTLFLAANSSSASYGTDVVLTATIGDVDSLSGKTVKFYDEAALLGSATTDASGKASFMVTSPATGSHSYKAIFESDGTNTAADSNTIAYTVSQADQAPLSFGPYSTAKTYGNADFSVVATGGSGSGSITYQSSNTDVATVDNNGNVTIVGVGSFTITANKAADTNYKMQTATTDIITVSPKAIKITEGANGKYTPGSNNGLTFELDAVLETIVSITIDGNVIGTDKYTYTVTENGTLITLKPDYLATLSSGNYTIDIQSTSGTVSADFTSEAKSTDTTKPEDTKSPQTGDTGNMALWLALLFVSGGAIGTIGITRKKRREQN